MVPIESITLTAAIDDLATRGFTEHFVVKDQGLFAVSSGKIFPPDGVVITEYHRFEGVSDPDDLTILYAIETRGGLRGTLVDAFGVYADPRVGRFMADVAVRRGSPPPQQPR